MSIEVDGFDIRKDGKAAAAIVDAASDFCYAQGMSGSEAYITGNRGASYAAEILIASLARIGCWPPEGFDEAGFIEATKEVALASNVTPDRLPSS